MSKPLNTAINILLVEDSPSDADVLQQTLQQAGAGRFQFTWVERLGDALARLREEAFDVLLLDLSLPDSSGPETFRRAQKAARGLPIVVLTGVNDESVGLAAVREGVQDYLVKGQADGQQIARAIRYAVGRARAEEQLRLAQKMESVGLLAAGVAHDFNNLLTSIMGNASMLREEVLEESLDKLDAVILAAEKAADLTRQLLAYAGKGRIVVENVNFSRVVRDIAQLLCASIPKKMNLKLALKPDLPGVEADRGQLQQIVMNLVINGAEAIGADQIGTVTITTGTQEVSQADHIADEVTGRLLAPGNYVRLEVADTGCGMDSEIRGKIFDPFFTTKFMGRGLGLAAVAGIVQAHRGAIQLDTAPGKGATFRVFLPAGAPPAAWQRQGPQLEMRGTATVLVVDDEAGIRYLVREALERCGYRVLVAGDGREALRIFEENAGDIGAVLLDLKMPVMGGDEVIDVLKSRNADLRVIVMSGYSGSEVMKTFADKGVSGYLQKPFTATRLAEELNAVLTAGSAKGPD